MKQVSRLIELHQKTVDAKMKRDFDNFKIYRRERNELSDELKLVGISVHELN